jgi:hypothetical protein
MEKLNIKMSNKIQIQIKWLLKFALLQLPNYLGSPKWIGETRSISVMYIPKLVLFIKLSLF